MPIMAFAFAAFRKRLGTPAVVVWHLVALGEKHFWAGPKTALHYFRSPVGKGVRPPPPRAPHPQGCSERGAPYPSRAPSLCPATVSLTASAGLNGSCNRQQPPPTASATSSNRLPNRFWGRLSGPFPSNACRGWALKWSSAQLLCLPDAAVGDGTTRLFPQVRTYVYPVHTSCTFLFARTVASGLYLLLLRLLTQHYAIAFEMIDTCVSDTPLSREEQQIWDQYDAFTPDSHPDAYACRLKLVYATLGCRATMPCKWKVPPHPQ